MAALRRKSDDEWIDAVNFLEPQWGEPPINQPPPVEDHKRLRYAFLILKIVVFTVVFRHVTKTKKQIMPTDKPSFYAPIFQISIQSDQKWLGYALLNFENYHFWDHMTLRDMTKNQKLIIRTYKQYFYVPSFQISIQSDQNWLRYAFLNFEN